MTPEDAPGERQIIEGYGGGAFRVNGVVREGSLIVFATAIQPWPVSSLAEVTAESLEPVLAAAGEVELLLLGCGPRMGAVPAELRAALKQAQIALEAMDTGAACRTFNVLVAEERRAAAALIAI